MDQINSTASCPSGSLRYIWRSGDTLTRVATTFGTTISAMIDTNPAIDFMSISEGTVVCVPSRLLTCPDSNLYAIRSGDTLSSIAARYGITTGALMDLNPYVEPTQLAVGQYICVPRSPASGESSPPAENLCRIGSEIPNCSSIRAANNACTGTDTVQCGQTLYDILNKYAITFTEFSALNPRLVVNPLLPGQRYYYPLKDCACTDSGSYTIQSGDTISSIAAAFGISASELLRRNPNRTPQEFVPGTEICITFPTV